MIKMKRNNTIYSMTLLALLIAIIFVLDLTVGAVSFGGFTITLVGIPVAIAACVFGPYVGCLMGFFWGVTSLIKAATGIDAMGVQLMSINVFGTIFTCFVPRMIDGLLAGYLYRLISKVDKKGYVNACVTCASVAVMNTILFLSSLELFFWNTDYIIRFREYYGTDNVIIFMALVASWNALLEIGFNLGVGAACVFSLNKIASSLGVKSIFTKDKTKVETKE